MAKKDKGLFRSKKEPFLGSKKQSAEKEKGFFAGKRSASSEKIGNKKTRGFSSRKKVKKIPKVLNFFLLFFFWLGLILLGIVAYWAYDLPDLSKIQAGTRRPHITFITVDGQYLSSYGELQEKFYTVEELPPTLIQAVLAIEDRRFYHHKGIDFIGLARALWTNIRYRSFRQGGSTLTQQLAKNLFLTPERSIKRKVQELFLALWLEHKFTKNQILSIYLNRVYLGGGTYGIGAASEKYFKKKPKNLSLLESALLAGLLKAPSVYSPLSSLEKSRVRTEIVLGEMQEEGFITSWQKTQALIDGWTPPPVQEKIEGVRYFTDWIVRQLPVLLNTQTPQDLIVVTTLDPKLQNLADDSIGQALKDPNFDGLQVSLLCMSTDGAVRAMIGGRSYEKSQFNRAVQGLRQPGSLFKMPLYLAALEKGKSPFDLIADGPIKIGSWRPKNFQWRSQGIISIQESFAFSVNTSAVRLAQEIGVSAIQKVAKKLGIHHSIASNLSISLGTSEVSLLEMTSAFAILANGGFFVEPFGVLEVRNSKGEVLYQKEKKALERVIDAEINQKMLDMLKEVVRRGTGKRAQVPGLEIAGKTGTTQERQDGWFVGFTPYLVTGIWLGLDEEDASVTKKQRTTGGQLPAHLFSLFMKRIIS